MESHERQLYVGMNKRPFMERLAAWLSHLSRPTHLLFHLVAVLLIAGLEISLIQQITQSDQITLAKISVITVMQSLLLFYGIGYWILPKLFYGRQYGVLILTIFFAFWGTYVLNRTTFFTIEPNSLQSALYVDRIRSIIGPTGLLGCFTSLRVFLWNFAFVWITPIIPLGFKVTKEMIVFRRQQLELKRKRLLLDRDNALLKLNFLKAQVSPHFLFNTLNSIYSRVVGVDDGAADLILHLSELMRYNLYEANAEQVPLSQELNYLQNYVLLEQARHSDRVLVSLQVPEQKTNLIIAPLLLNAFVENAFKHGIKSGQEGAYVLIDAYLEQNVLQFAVENSLSKGPTIATQRQHRSGGVGLPNVHKRLDLLYTGRYELTHDITDDYYRITLQLRLSATDNRTATSSSLTT